VLLSCAVDTSKDDIISSCQSSLQKLMSRLSQAKETDDWDIGDICLTQWNDSVTATFAAWNSRQGQKRSNSSSEERLARHLVSTWDAQESASPRFSPLSAPWDLADDLTYPWATLLDVLEPSGMPFGFPS
jgi:hypothetical protein